MYMVNVKLLDLCYGGISFLFFLVLFRKEKYHIQSFAYFIHPLLVPTWKRSHDFGFRYNLLLLIRRKKLLLGNCKEV